MKASHEVLKFRSYRDNSLYQFYVIKIVALGSYRDLFLLKDNSVNAHVCVPSVINIPIFLSQTVLISLNNIGLSTFAEKCIENKNYYQNTSKKNFNFLAISDESLFK